MKNKETGNKGEDLACMFLLQKGYRILARNWRYHPKEIDIIAQITPEELHIVEVKTRSTDYFEKPGEILSAAKQRYLIEAASHYIEQNDIECDVYFDLITVYLNYSPPKIIHLPECFSS